MNVTLRTWMSVVAISACCAELVPARAVAADCPSDAKTVARWLNDTRLANQAAVEQAAAKNRAEVKAAAGKRNNTNQTEAPAIATASPSLVDQSSASDLLGIGLNLIGVGSESSDTTGTTATVSAYAIRAALTGEDPLRPEYYVDKTNAKWRRFFVTLGADFPEEGDKETERGVIGGAKFILWTERDISEDQTFTSRAHGLLDAAAKGLGTVVNDEQLLAEIEHAICTRKTATGTLEVVDESKLSQATKSRVDELFRTTGKASLEYETNAAAFADEINQRPQVAIEVLTNQRQNDGTDEYTATLTADLTRSFDIGVVDRAAFTFNASYEGLDRSRDGEEGQDSHGGKVGAQVRFYKKPTVISKRIPWMASLATDGRWLTKNEPRYRVQAKFSLALWDGIDLPLSVTWASTSEFNEEDEVIGNVGFTFDTAKLLPRLGIGG